MADPGKPCPPSVAYDLLAADKAHLHKLMREMVDHQTLDYVYNSGLQEIMVDPDIWDRMSGKMTKTQFDALAKAIQAIEGGIKDMHIPLPEQYHDQLMELITARIGLVCAESNRRFDSFRFAEAARKNARRGMKTGSAARSSTRATKRSNP